MKQQMKRYLNVNSVQLLANINISQY